MGFPIGDLFSIRSFLLAGAQACQLFENDLMYACKYLQFYSVDITSAEHFNFKHYLIEREVFRKLRFFNWKLYENGKQSFQF